MRQPKLYALLLAAALALSACAGDGQYPYAPQFMSPQSIPPTALKVPPKPGSKAYKTDMEMVVNTQRGVSEETRVAITEENHVAAEMITLPVLGEDLTEYHYPATYHLLDRAGSDAWRIGDVARDYWKVTRPWQADERVKLYAERIESGSYPSGHALTYHIWARILGDLFPEARSRLFQRADEIANHRVQGGVHFFFDIRASALLSDRIYYCQLKKSPAFQEAFREAQKEVEARRGRPLPMVAGPKCKKR